MYIYNGHKINNPIYIHFLCGKKYDKKSKKDKRNVLLNYINSIPNNYALILEKFFYPFHYKKMKFNDLEEVELMASYYARSIIVFHETVSTAAEIALFGSNENLKDKILVLYADKDLVVVDSIGSFLELAYFKPKKVKKIPHNFKTELYTKKQISYYNTYFNENKIDENLEKELNRFWSGISTESDFRLIKKDNIIKYKNYYFYEDKEASIILSYEFIFSLTIACLLNEETLKNFLNDEYVSNICYSFKLILKNTIEHKEGITLEKITIKTIDKKDINIPINFCLTILKKLNLISISRNELSVSEEFKNNSLEYIDLIKEIEEPNFFEQMEEGNG